MFSRNAHRIWPAQGPAQELDAVLQDLFDPLVATFRQTPTIAADIYDEEGAFVIEAELPGVERSRVGVQAQGREVIISVKPLAQSAQASAPQSDPDVLDAQVGEEQAEAHPQQTGAGKPRQIIRKGRYDGARVTSWTFPEELDVSAVSAKLAEGVLIVSIPKSRGRSSRVVDIQ